MKINKKLILFNWQPRFKFTKWTIVDVGLFTKRVVYRIGFLQIDIFYL